MGACFKARIANAVVAAARQEAAQAGIDMMRQGGNIVDAAIAASCVIGELLPS